MTSLELSFVPVAFIIVLLILKLMEWFPRPFDWVLSNVPMGYFIIILFVSIVGWSAIFLVYELAWKPLLEGVI
jgi:hypothetical protein